MKIREIRKCTMCTETFRTLNSSNRKTCSNRCSIKYEKSPKVIAKRKEYYNSTKIKAQRKEYRERPENKARRKEYEKRPESIDKRKACQKRRQDKHTEDYT